MTGGRRALAVALCALATSFVVPAAQGSPPGGAPDGRLCSYAAREDPTAPAGTMTGQLNGGPLLWDRDFWLHCRLRVDSNVHHGAAAAQVHGPSSAHVPGVGTGAVAVVAWPVAYQSPQGSYDYLCTSVSWPTATGPNWLYWRPGDVGRDVLPGTHDDTLPEWTSDPGAACSGVTEVETRPIADYVTDYVIDVITDVVDPRICAALVGAHAVRDPAPAAGPQPGDATYVDAEGDVFVDDGDGITEGDWRDDLWWDCPDYADWWASPPQPGADGTPVIDVAVGPRPGGVYSAVLGYVAVTMSPGDAQPAYTLAGELAVPARWSCWATPYVPTQPYTVTCDPVAVPMLTPECAVVQADVTTTSPGGRARAAVLCDADATPEVRTQTVLGVGGHDSALRSWLAPVPVTQFRCTLSNGLGAAPVPGFVAGCGDPGAVRVEAQG